MPPSQAPAARGRCGRAQPSHRPSAGTPARARGRAPFVPAPQRPRACARPRCVARSSGRSRSAEHAPPHRAEARHSIVPPGRRPATSRPRPPHRSPACPSRSRAAGATRDAHRRSSDGSPRRRCPRRHRRTRPSTLDGAEDVPIRHVPLEVRDVQLHRVRCKPDGIDVDVDSIAERVLQLNERLPERLPRALLTPFPPEARGQLGPGDRVGGSTRDVTQEGERLPPQVRRLTARILREP